MLVIHENASNKKRFWSKSNLLECFLHHEVDDLVGRIFVWSRWPPEVSLLVARGTWSAWCAGTSCRASSRSECWLRSWSPERNGWRGSVVEIHLKYIWNTFETLYVLPTSKNRSFRDNQNSTCFLLLNFKCQNSWGGTKVNSI
jgi:hypothetical protein